MSIKKSADMQQKYWIITKLKTFTIHLGCKKVEEDFISPQPRLRDQVKPSFPYYIFYASHMSSMF